MDEALAKIILKTLKEYKPEKCPECNIDMVSKSAGPCAWEECPTCGKTADFYSD